MIANNSLKLLGSLFLLKFKSSIDEEYYVSDVIINKESNMQGTARYNGELVVFTETVLNPWTRQLDFLVSYEGGRWIGYKELDDVVFYIDTPLPRLG